MCGWCNRVMLVAAATGVLTAVASGRPVEVLINEGDAVGPDSLLNANAPFVDGAGGVGFLGDLALAGGGADDFVWLDGANVFQTMDALPDVLSGGESSMGVSAAGGFIYSPSFNGDDAVWTQNGLLAVENTQAPGFAMGVVTTFHSRPAMIPNGTCYWVAGINTSGGTSSEFRVLYRSTDATPGTITLVLSAGDLVDGIAIGPGSGLGFDFDFSDDGANHIHDVNLDTGSTANDGAVYLKLGAAAATAVAREAMPSGSGDNWDNFDLMVVNDAGTYVFSGDTDGATTSDEFIALNGVIGIREGDTIDGVTLTSSSFVRALALNNCDQIAHQWADGGGTEYLFFAETGVLADSVKLLQTGDTVDTDGNGVDDATVIDFNASTVAANNGFLGDDGAMYVHVDLQDIATGAEFDAVLRVTAGTCAGDTDGDGDVGFPDLLAVLSNWGPCTCCAADFDGDGDVGFADLLTVLSNWGPCP